MFICVYVHMCMWIYDHENVNMCMLKPEVNTQFLQNLSMRNFERKFLTVLELAKKTWDYVAGIHLCSTIQRVQVHRVSKKNRYLFSYKF